MPMTLMAALSLHVLAGVFWAGSTFTLARTGGADAERLFRPQMGAAIVTILAGAYVGSATSDSGFSPTEEALLVGIACAIVAVAVQGGLCGRAIRKLRQGDRATAVQARIALGQRIAAGLLLVTVVCMAVAPYV